MARTPASLNSHPIHPMLIAFPLGLWVFSFVCDIVFQLSSEPAWDTVALYTLIGGIVGAVLAAVPGFIDWLSLPAKSRTRKIGLWHMILNVGALLLYGVNAVWRLGETSRSGGPLALSAVTILALVVSGWLGGALIYEHGVGVVGNTRDNT